MVFLMKTNLRGQLVVFTGSLITMTRKEACHLVLSAKGNIANHVSKETNILVVGHYSKNLFDKEQLTKKEKMAQLYQSEGFPIMTINEKQLLKYAIDDLKSKYTSI